MVSDISVANFMHSYTIVVVTGDAISPPRMMIPAGITEKRGVAPGPPALARRLLAARAMSFAAIVDRVRGDFMEMPGLELTLPQAVRLWSLGMDDCRFVIDALVDAGFLTWTARRTIVRTGRDLGVGPQPQTADIPVKVLSRTNKSVWSK